MAPLIPFTAKEWSLLAPQEAISLARAPEVLSLGEAPSQAEAPPPLEQVPSLAGALATIHSHVIPSRVEGARKRTPTTYTAARSHLAEAEAVQEVHHSQGEAHSQAEVPVHSLVEASVEDSVGDSLTQGQLFSPAEALAGVRGQAVGAEVGPPGEG